MKHIAIGWLFILYGYWMVRRKTDNAHEWAQKTKGTRWLKNKNLKTKNRDRKKTHTRVWGSQRVTTKALK